MLTKKFLSLLIFAAMLSTTGCDNAVEPVLSNKIIVAGEEFVLPATGDVIDRKLNEDNSFQSQIRLDFNNESYILFTLNSEKDRSFNPGGYNWSANEENGNISSVRIFLEEGSQQYGLDVNTFSIEKINDNHVIDFDLDGDIQVSGSFTGLLEFQERYNRGNGSFQVDGNVYDIPYFGLTEIIQNTDGFYLARLYFYNVDPSNPFLRGERSHSFYLTLVQATPEALQPGNYAINESIRPFSLFDGKPLVGPNYQFEGGSATFSKTDDLFDVSFTILISEGGLTRSATGSYSGPLNGW